MDFCFFFFILFLLEYVNVWCLTLKLEGQDLLYAVILSDFVLHNYVTQS